MDWTPHRCKQLSALWDMGLAASQIGAEFGISRSAVLGKVHRLKLPARRLQVNGVWRDQRIVNGEPILVPKPSRRRRKNGYVPTAQLTPQEREKRNRYQREYNRRKPRNRMSRAESMQLADEERARTKWSAFEASPTSIGLMELDKTTCRWPQGEDPVRYCGCKACGVYCPEHHALAYRKAE